VGQKLVGAGGAVLTVVANRDWKPEGGVVVYNFQVEGDHTYFVGDVHAEGEWVWTHNACNPLRANMIANGESFGPVEQAAHIIPRTGWTWADDALNPIIAKVTDAKLIDHYENGFKATTGHNGTHTKAYVQLVIRTMQGLDTPEELLGGIRKLRAIIEKSTKPS
jgi:hypothetical protein